MRGKKHSLLFAVGITASLFILSFLVAWAAFRLQIGKENLIMLYLVGVLFVAVLSHGYYYASVIGLGGFIAINYFFTAPVYSLHIFYVNDIVMLATFLLTAVVSGLVASRQQQLKELAEQNAAAAEALICVQAEQEAARMEAEREKLRADLLRSVAHDLRSPLTAIAGASSLLQDDYTRLNEAEQQRLIADIREESVWLGSLVENILNMTRIIDGHLLLNKEEESVDDVVTEVVSHIERFMQGRDFHVRLPEEPCFVPMDGRLIEQVYLNLLENALRHTPPGSAISLSVSVQDGFLRSELADLGPGIPEEKRAHLFERFVCFDRAVTDGRRGMGLGLSICRSIVEAHGGSIWVEDNQPCGARFVFTLPLAEEVPGMTEGKVEHEG